jgi:hypothetical protein
VKPPSLKRGASAYEGIALDGDTVGLVTYVPRAVQLADAASAAIRKLIGSSNGRRL